MIGTILARKSVSETFQAFNRKDLAAFMAGWHQDGVFIYPGDIPESGTFKGKEAVTAWFRNMMDKFQTIEFTVKNVCVQHSFDLVGTNTLAVQWDLKLKNLSGRTGFNTGTSIIQVKRGKVVLVKDYIFDLGPNFRANWGIESASS